MSGFEFAAERIKMLDNGKIPRHVAIIMDGNGRWAKERGLPRTFGHRQGIESVRKIVDCARQLGIGVLTLFAFSTENWSRSNQEVSALMRYLDNFLGREVDKLHKKNVRFMVIGRSDPIPERIQKKIKAAAAKTKDNTGLILVFALNYGSRQEIVDAVKNFAAQAKEGKINIEDLNTELFDGYLYTAGLPDPDLFIRTSGEMRISNFLLWQLSYAEMYFSPKNWPEFGKDDLEEAVKEYQRRERRFGGVKC